MSGPDERNMMEGGSGCLTLLPDPGWLQWQMFFQYNKIAICNGNRAQKKENCPALQECMGYSKCYLGYVVLSRQ